MTAKQRLNQIRIIDIKLKNLISERDGLTAKIQNPNINGVRVQTSRGTDPPWMKNIIRRDELMLEIAKVWDKFISEKWEIIERLNSLNEVKYIEVLSKKYLEYKPLDKIAREMKYSYDYVLKTHGEALKAFERGFRDST